MVSLIFATIDNEPDARKIAHILVEEQIVACVNIISNIRRYVNYSFAIIGKFCHLIEWGRSRNRLKAGKFLPQVFSQSMIHFVHWDSCSLQKE